MRNAPIEASHDARHEGCEAIPVPGMIFRCATVAAHAAELDLFRVSRDLARGKDQLLDVRVLARTASKECLAIITPTAPPRQSETSGIE